MFDDQTTKHHRTRTKAEKLGDPGASAEARHGTPPPRPFAENPPRKASGIRGSFQVDDGSIRRRRRVDCEDREDREDLEDWFDAR